MEPLRAFIKSRTRTLGIVFTPRSTSVVGPFFGVCSLREAVKEGRAGEKDSGKNFRGFFLRLTLQGDEGCSVVHPEKERVLIVGLQVQAGGSSDFDNNSN